MKKLLYTLGGLIILAIVLIVPLQFFDLPWLTAEQKPPSPPKEKEPSVVQIAAFGDTMMHGPQIRGGEQSDGTYNFKTFFQEVQPYLAGADLTIGNLETTLAGPDKPYAGYPLFNAPDAIADALLDSGVDLMSTANNHSMDTGEDGVIRTYDVLNQKGIKPVGTAPSSEKRKPTIVEKNGITFAFLAYTESTNGLPIPEGKEYLVNTIDQEQIAQDIQESKQRGAEFVVVSLHFGMEYQRQPNEKQVQIANQVLQDGADVILGSHPHVLQPMEKVSVQGKEKLITYSLGNFVSNQFFPYTDEGAILFFNVEKNHQTNKVQLTDVSYLPTFVHKYQENGQNQYVIIPTEDEKPKTDLPYPNINPEKWRTAFHNTVELMKEKATIPVFSQQP